MALPKLCYLQVVLSFSLPSKGEPCTQLQISNSPQRGGYVNIHTPWVAVPDGCNSKTESGKAFPTASASFCGSQHVFKREKCGCGIRPEFRQMPHDLPPLFPWASYLLIRQSILSYADSVLGWSTPISYP